MSQNPFLSAILRYDAYTENGAVSHSTTGDALLDYFAKAGTYRNRPLEQVFADMGRIWAESPKVALQILFYLRMITRSTKGFWETEAVQRGQGVRDEYRKALRWWALYHQETLYLNFWLMPLVGSWRDLWHEDLLDVLQAERVYELVARGLNDPYNSALIAKYLPRIRSRGQTHTRRHAGRNAFARGLCAYLGWTEAQYRRFKASGQAHTFQRQMSQGLWDQIDFGKIAGKALFRLVNGKGKDGKTALERHGQERRYLDWLATQPTAKYTGYVYELFRAVSPAMSAAQKYTVDKQFDGLIELASRDGGALGGNIWCALDTSGSMSVKVADKTTAYDVCVSLGIYFATLNRGAFHNHVVFFDHESRVMPLGGKSFVDRALQIKKASTAWGGTNFQSIIDEIVRVRLQNPHIALSDYPTTLLVVSDMQFNPVEGGTVQTNYEAAMQKLAAVGLPKMRIVWWFVSGRGSDFPNKLEDEGVSMIGGFDGAVISLLLGGERAPSQPGEPSRQANAYDMMLRALDQELLRQVRLS